MAPTSRKMPFGRCLFFFGAAGRHHNCLTCPARGKWRAFDFRKSSTPTFVFIHLVKDFFRLSLL
ncbi:MAG: hypothetical protein D6714_18305 [Bacteroidetes bacterium]|nr:MAG: hypothetical protein D6714_18305 [Bacteroidota bacterium]